MLSEVAEGDLTTEGLQVTVDYEQKLVCCVN